MKKPLKTIGSLLALAALAGAQPVQAEAKYTLRWFLGHEDLDYFEQAAVDFKTVVEKESGGEIAVDIVFKAPDAPFESFDDPSIAGKVARGEVEMGHSFTDVMGSFDPRFHVFEAPYLFRGYRHLEGVFEGPVGADLLLGLRAKGIRGLSFTYSGGANGIATHKTQLRTPSDLKGLKIGALDNAVNRAWISALGAVHLPIPHQEKLDLVSLVKDRGADGLLITWRNLELVKNNADLKHMNMTGSSYLVSVTYINEKFYQSLPEKYQKLLTNASREAGIVERGKTVQLNETSRRLLRARGVRSVPVSEANRAAFQAALAPAYRDAIENTVGKDLIERIRNTQDGLQHPSIFGVVKR